MKKGIEKVICSETFDFLSHYYLDESGADTDSMLRFKDAIKRLPNRERVSYVLSLDSYSMRDIAKYLDVSVMTVSRAIRNAKVVLGDCVVKVKAEGYEY